MKCILSVALSTSPAPIVIKNRPESLGSARFLGAGKLVCRWEVPGLFAYTENGHI